MSESFVVMVMSTVQTLLLSSIVEPVSISLICTYTWVSVVSVPVSVSVYWVSVVPAPGEEWTVEALVLNVELSPAVGPMSANGGPISVNGGPASVNGGPISVNGGPLSVNGGPMSVNGGPISVNGGVRNTGVVAKSATTAFVGGQP